MAGRAQNFVDKTRGAAILERRLRLIVRGRQEPPTLPATDELPLGGIDLEAETVPPFGTASMLRMNGRPVQNRAPAGPARPATTSPTGAISTTVDIVPLSSPATAEDGYRTNGAPRSNASHKFKAIVLLASPRSERLPRIRLRWSALTPRMG